MKKYVAENIFDMTFDQTVQFERCNVYRCTFNVTCYGERCNFIECINTNKLITYYSNIIDRDDNKRNNR